MIKWIHQNKRSVTVFLMGGIVIMAMSIFGIDTGSSRKERYAIKLGDEEISMREFQREKKNRQEMMIQRYKQMFGENYRQFAKQIYNLPNQEVVDAIIDEHLLNREVQKANLFLKEHAVKEVIMNDMFGGNFNSDDYQNYLINRGISSRAFEEEVKKDLLLQNYRTILSDLSEPSKQEIKSFAEKQETTYDVEYIEIDPANFESKAQADDGALEAFYNSRQTDYEIPARVSYQYLVFDPQKNLDLVELGADDIELFYADNEQHFMNPEEAKVRHIQITFPKESSDEKKEELKKRAEEAHAKATAGEDFITLVSQFSDDLTTVTNGGDLGWVKKGRMNKSFDDVIFQQKASGIAPLISSDFGFQIVKVEEYKPAAVKKLEEVKAQIETELKKREAPAFTAAKANEIYANWTETEKTLSEIAVQNSMAAAVTSAALSKDADPDPQLKSLTLQVLKFPDLQKQIVELGDKSILVQVDKFEESRVPAFTEVKAQVLKDYQKIEAKKLARDAAQQLLVKLGEEKEPLLRTAASAAKLEVKEQKGLTPKTPAQGIFADESVQKNIFAASNALEKPKKVIEVDGKQFIFQVKNLTLPKAEELEAKIATYKTQALNANAQMLIESNLSRLKAKAEIDVDPSILASGTASEEAL